MKLRKILKEAQSAQKKFGDKGQYALQKPKEFYINKPPAGYEPVTGKKITVPGYEEMDLFLHKIPWRGRGAKKCWAISDGISGAKLIDSHSYKGSDQYLSASNKLVDILETPEELIKRLKEGLDSKGKNVIWKLINDMVKKHGISPRYQGEASSEL